MCVVYAQRKLYARICIFLKALKDILSCKKVARCTKNDGVGHRYTNSVVHNFVTCSHIYS